MNRVKRGHAFMLLLVLLCGCHDASENRPQADPGSELVQALTTKLPPSSYERLPRVDLKSDRAKTIFGEALAKMASEADQAQKDGDKSMKVEWQYIAQKESFASIELQIDLKTLTYTDTSGEVTVSNVTPEIVEKLSTSRGLAATPEMFKEFGCTLTYKP